MACFNSTCLKHSPGSVLGICWGCACPFCLHDLEPDDPEDLDTANIGGKTGSTESPSRGHGKRSSISPEDWRDNEMNGWLQSMEADLDFYPVSLVMHDHLG